MGGLLGFLIIAALILIPWLYAQSKWNGIRPRDVHTKLSPEQVRRIFESKVVGSTWKVHDDGNPMVAISRLIGGVRQQISVAVVAGEGGTSARICVSRVTWKLTGPNKAHTLRMRMSAFVTEVRRQDPSARIVDLPVDKRLRVDPFPGARPTTVAAAATPAHTARTSSTRARSSVDSVHPVDAFIAGPEPKPGSGPSADPDPAVQPEPVQCSTPTCAQPVQSDGLCALHALRAAATTSSAEAVDAVGLEEQSAELLAGWYPDRRDDALLRWWDGSSWTVHTLSAGDRTPAVGSQGEVT